MSPVKESHKHALPITIIKSTEAWFATQFLQKFRHIANTTQGLLRKPYLYKLKNMKNKQSITHIPHAC